MAVVWIPSQDQILNSNLKKFTEFTSISVVNNFFILSKLL